MPVSLVVCCFAGVTIGMDEMFVEVDENVDQRILCASLMTGTLERPAQVTVVYQDRRARSEFDNTAILLYSYINLDGRCLFS